VGLDDLAHDGQADADVEVVHHTDGEAFGDPDVLALWLTVAPDGSVTSGEEVPLYASATGCSLRLGDRGPHLFGSDQLAVKAMSG
jgi:hypothetical protein